ncbi:MAG: phosphatidylserine decarboxylase [Ignavibacteria bacterium]|nr:phosphatidylserine decarboxylase [Ignavibacteria bacterium]
MNRPGADRCPVGDGMSLISSVNLTPEEGAFLRKGEELGYFLFGGSDIVMILQDRGIVLEAETGMKYPQGERIARVGFGN